MVGVGDFKRLWNGLFNYVWMSDKPLVQVCIRISVKRKCAFLAVILEKLFCAYDVEFGRNYIIFYLVRKKTWSRSVN